MVPRSVTALTLFVQFNRCGTGRFGGSAGDAVDVAIFDLATFGDIVDVFAGSIFVGDHDVLGVAREIDRERCRCGGRILGEDAASDAAGRRIGPVKK